MSGVHALLLPRGGNRGLAGVAAILSVFLLLAGSWGCASSAGAPAAAAAPTAPAGESSLPGPPPGQDGGTPPPEKGVPPASAEPAGTGAEAGDLCTAPPGAEKSWLDRFHSWVGRTVCRTVNGFDGFFGDERAEDERQGTGGLMGLNIRWSEHDALEPQFRFRARLALPNLSRRLKVFVGRETQDEYLSDNGNQSVAETLARNEDYDWVLGLGGSTTSMERSRFRFNLGVKVSSSPQLYGKGQYRWLVPLGDQRTGRFRQTVFWRSRDGFGTTTNLDVEQRFKQPLLLRWEGSGTISEISEGVEWFTGLSLYQELTADLAARYRVWIRGATDAPVRTEEYGFQVFLRRRMLRDWFFGQVGSGVSWIRDHPWEPRKASFSILVGVEMQFGERHVY